MYLQHTQQAQTEAASTRLSHLFLQEALESAKAQARSEALLVKPALDILTKVPASSAAAAR